MGHCSVTFCSSMKKQRRHWCLLLSSLMPLRNGCVSSSSERRRQSSAHQGSTYAEGDDESIRNRHGEDSPAQTLKAHFVGMLFPTLAHLALVLAIVRSVHSSESLCFVFRIGDKASIKKSVSCCKHLAEEAKQASTVQEEGGEGRRG